MKLGASCGLNERARGESTDEKDVLETGEGFVSPELAEASGDFLDGRSEERPNQRRRKDHEVLAALGVELRLLGPFVRQAQLLSFNVQRKQMWRRRCTVKYRCLNSFQMTHISRLLTALFPLVDHKRKKNALYWYLKLISCAEARANAGRLFLSAVSEGHSDP